ncbi:hypothetical protein ACIPVK_03345 [Paeniglutamicibacter sp. MACA_103]|uniref:hypothetical protein n=1 Tax=Paeniglutamicibacter sp. MACA_103 TaxID=3377337 RepID=UPI003895BDF6
MTAYDRSTRRPPVGLLPLAATALLLAGCVPLDGPVPGATATDPAPAPGVAPATARLGGADCEEPVVTAGEASNGGWKIIAAMELDTTSGREKSTVFLDEPFGASLIWDGNGPGTDRFTEAIGEAIGYPTVEVIEGLDRITTMFTGLREPDRTLGYRAVEQVSVPITLVCGNQGARGTVNTWSNIETGLIDCSLPANEPPSMPSAMARERYCPEG